MTTPRRERRQNPATAPRVRGKTPAEMSEPYEPPDPEDRWPLNRPAYLIVVDQLRDWQPGRHSPSLAELLETRPGWTREPEPDLEAEP